MMSLQRVDNDGSSSSSSEEPRLAQQPVLSSGQTRIVFLRLDPILQRLLKEVTDLRALLVVEEDDNNASSNTTLQEGGHLDNDYEAFLLLLKDQIKELEDLTRHVRSLGIEFAPSLVLLADYITLPLAAIFHIPILQSKLLNNASETNTGLPTRNKTTNIDYNNNDPNERQRTAQIQLTFVRKLYATAATTIQVYVETTCCSGAPTSLSLKGQHLTKYLIALTSSLPSSVEVEEAVASRQMGYNPCIGKIRPTLFVSPATDGSGGVPSLDDGSDLWITILKAMATILSYCNEETILEAWHGTLLMRMADCVAGFIGGTPSVVPPQVALCAINTLQAMLRYTPNATRFWQSVFPGVFTPLYKGILEASRGGPKTGTRSSSNLSSSIEASALSAMTTLLRVTLSSISVQREQQQRLADKRNNNSSGSSSTSRPDAILSQLTMLAKKQNQLSHQKSASADIRSETNVTTKNSMKNDRESTDDAFLYQIQTRLVAPLAVILRQESISRCESARKGVITLCRVLLIDTRYCWTDTPVLPRSETDNDDATTTASVDDNSRSNNNSSNSDFERLPFEICLSLEQDPQETIASYAGTTLREYAELTTSSSDPSLWMVSRIIELAEKIPVLMQGGKKVEIRMEVQLLRGFLQYAKGLKSIGSALATSTTIKDAFVRITDVDFESSIGKRLLTNHGNGLGESSVAFCRADLESASLINDMLVVFGQTLGGKYGAIFVDNVISDFFEASLRIPSHPDSFADWLHEWIGSLVVARAVLQGAFAPSEKRLSTTTTTTTETGKAQARRHRILGSLASSILPLLVDSAMWNLPLTKRQTNLEGQSNVSAPKPVTPLVSQGNTTVAVLLLDLIGKFCECLGKSTLSDVLYPVVTRASQNNNDTVKSAADRTLATMAVARGFESVEGMIYQEKSRLIASMLARLRLPGGTQVPGRRDSEEILSVVASLRWILTMLAQIKLEDDLFMKRVARNGLLDLMSLLDYRLDHLFLQKILGDYDVEEICGLHKAFFNYYLSHFSVNEKTVYSYRMKGLARELKQPWLDTLSIFRKSTPSGLHGALKEAIVDHRWLEEPAQSLSMSRNDASVFSKLIARNGYLMSYQKLKSRISACECLTSGFKLLAFVGSEYQDQSDEQNYVHNSILREVAELWPSCKARLVSISEEVLQAKNRKASLELVPTFATRGPCDRPSVDVATQRIYLARLFTLIGTMCECAGDFMADRFRNDVWTVMARHLETTLRQQVQDGTSHVHSQSTALVPKSVAAVKGDGIVKHIISNQLIISGSTWSTSERLLVRSILQCLNQVIRQEDCGRALGAIFVPIGSMLLPLLDMEGDTEIGDLAMESLKMILKIDCDVLRRPLLELSSIGIPPCPLKMTSECLVTAAKEIKTAAEREVSKSDNSVLAIRCRELMAFIGTLPEQSI